MSQDEPPGRDPAPQPTETVVGGEVEWGLAFEPGSVLRDRYRIRSVLGAGGMGEVWHAFDLKLRVEVALKGVRPELVVDEGRRESLRSEVRAAREVVSPNVCRVFDLIEIDGQELVSMEYVDGTTLLEVLQDRAPLDPPEAQEIASQFLAGLEAIHQVGLVHRDVKPENIMVTRTGRVVVMDFGLARSAAEGAGTVSGTRAYMAPEQARGITDARSDLFSAGVILAEMVSPGGIRDFESRKGVWDGVRSEPVQVPDSPWSPVVRRAVAKDPEERFASAHDLTRALEEVAFRVHDEIGLEPYPGLSSFDEDDAEYFFGREAEVEAVWQKLQSAQLLGIIGASGAGKSSFIGAGLVPSAPEGWSIVRCTPGSAAVDSLRRSVLSEIQDDATPVRSLAAGGDSAIVEAFGTWRQAHDSALLIVDQFEELFTQNAEEEQRRCAEIIGRIALDADVHVLLSMRDDFLMRCHQHEQLRPMFSELTGLDTPHGSALRRAVVQPALRCGYRFEDEELADEILAEVEGERGALPLLAFALARLWDRRDRENGLITRQAYRDLGGVGGALARHAEATLERIGVERAPIVREVFRNLVTAQGTRASRDADELLSVFRENRNDAVEVLHDLIDARLLTSYEVREEKREPTQRVEIIHESLIAAWPRLVGWRTQDADAARLRDELRQAARAWHEHGRTDDRLWTGAAFKEYEVWRERYPGGLTDLEEAFVTAMTGLATRRRRRRRAAAATVVIFLAVVATVLGALWRRSVAETRRAEAAKLLALAQAQLDTDPAEALALATASLELADTPAARLFVLRVLWEGPSALVVEATDSIPRFSPAGGRLAVSGMEDVVKVWSDTGDGPIVLRGLEVSGGLKSAEWISESLLAAVVGGGSERLRVWSLPEGEVALTIELGGPTYAEAHGNRVLTETSPSGQGMEGELLLRAWQLPDGEPQELGWVDPGALGARWSVFDPSGTTWIYGKDRTIYARPLPVGDGTYDRVVGTHDADGVRPRFDVNGDLLVTADGEGELRVWSLAGPAGKPLRVIPRPEGAPASNRLALDPTARWVYWWSFDQVDRAQLWDLEALPGAQPLELRRSGSWEHSFFAFHPQGEWLAATTKDLTQLSLWPLRRPYPSVVKGTSSTAKGLAFSPDGRWLATVWPPSPGHARLLPLPHTGPTAVPELAEHSLYSEPVFDAAGQRLSGGSQSGDELSIVPLDGSEPQRLEGFLSDTWVGAVAFSPSGRLLAAASRMSAEKMLRVWKVDTGEVTAFELPRTTETGADVGFEDNVQNLWFTDEETLYTVGPAWFLRWNLKDGSSEEVLPLDYQVRIASASADGQRVLMIEDEVEGFSTHVCATPQLWDMKAEAFEELPFLGSCVRKIALEPGGQVAVTGDGDGIIRVGRVSGGEPHLLVGHEGAIEAVAISPDLRWVASVGTDGTLRLWPMPDLDKPPLHTLPHDELIAKLETLTNLRAVRDETSSTGWTIEVGPFPGWKTVPEW